MVQNPTGNIRKAYNPKLTVMVVEDHIIFTKTVRHALPEETIICVPTLEEAMHAYERHLPDMIFLDIDLPDGSGLEFLKKIKEIEPEAYVVMMTGSKLELDKELAYVNGADAYLHKPCSHEMIKKQAENYLAYRQEIMEGLINNNSTNKHAH